MLKDKALSCARIGIITGLAGVVATPGLADQIASKWDGPGSGSYDAAANWNPDVVPLNNGDTYTVEITPGTTVNYDVAELQEIDELRMDLNSTLNLTGVSLFDPTNLTVLGQARIAGQVHANNADFTATGTGTEFLGNTVSLSAINGSKVSIGATSYSSTGFIGGGTILRTVDDGSDLDLSSLQSINAGFNDANTNTRVQTISATLNSQINLSGVETITAPVRFEDRLDLTVQTGADIDLSSLKSIIGPASNTGRTNVNVSSGTMKLGPLERVDRVFIDVDNSGSVEAGGFNGVTLISNSTVGVRGGSEFNGATLLGDYDSREFTGGGTIFSSEDAGSNLDLSGLRSINAGFNDVNTNTRVQAVSATLNGNINLSGLTDVVAPARAEDRLDFVAETGGKIDLSSLETMDSAGAGRVRFAINDGMITVGTVNPDTRVDISVTGSDSNFTVLNQVTLHAPSSLIATDEALVSVGGNLRFTHTTESSVNLTSAIVQMNGDAGSGGAVQTLEAGGTDLGLVGSTSGNFGIGQLIVGDDGVTSIVNVLDDVSNGNRGAGGELEALYLFGIGNEGEQNEQDGLRILAGSTLVIDENVNIYALIDADMNGVTDDIRQWEHLNSWFTSGGPETIAFDGGFISTVVPDIIPEPTLAVTLGLLVAPLGLTRRRRIG